MIATTAGEGLVFGKQRQMCAERVNLEPDHDATTRSNKVVKKLVEIFPNHRRRHHRFLPTLTPPHDGDAWFREVQGGNGVKFQNLNTCVTLAGPGFG